MCVCVCVCVCIHIYYQTPNHEYHSQLPAVCPPIVAKSCQKTAQGEDVPSSRLCTLTSMAKKKKSRLCTLTSMAKKKNKIRKSQCASIVYKKN